MTDDLLDALPEGPGDVLALVNGLGATTELELHAIGVLLGDELTARGLRPVFTVSGTFTAALDMAGFSLTVTRLEEGWAELWTAPTRTPLVLPRPIPARSGGRAGDRPSPRRTPRPRLPPTRAATAPSTTATR